VTTPKLALPELSVSQAGKEITHNQALAILDQIAQLTVLDKDLATPPASPANGAAYIVASSPTGSWSGKAGQVAFWLSSVGAWTFVAPYLGMTARVADELDINGVAKLYGFTGASWVLPFVSAVAAPAELVTEATTSRTLGLSDAGKYIRFTSGSASTVTVAPQSSVTWLADTEIHIRRVGGGDLTITPGSGVTLNAPSGGTLVMTSAMTVTLKRVASDQWDVIGQTVPV
jgi:hypothetical protein